jgi:hypothetical protein
MVVSGPFLETGRMLVNLLGKRIENIVVERAFRRGANT